MVGSAATILAVACSMPQRCCQAFRVSHSGGSTSYHQLRGMAATSRGSRTARIARQLVPGVVGRRDAASASADIRSASYGSSSFVRNSLTAATAAQAGRRNRALAAPGGTVRMVSDESQFFTDPDAPEAVKGEGPPGPLEGGDQVSPYKHQHQHQSKLVATVRLPASTRRGRLLREPLPSCWRHCRQPLAAFSFLIRRASFITAVRTSHHFRKQLS